MSVEMTVSAPEMSAEAPAPEEPPKQNNSQNAAAKKTWTCSQCGATIEWLPPAVHHLHPSKIRCLKCQRAKQGAKAPVEVSSQSNQRRSAGVPHLAQVPRGLTLELVELCAYRAELNPSQVERLLAKIRSKLTPSPSDK